MKQQQTQMQNNLAEWEEVELQDLVETLENGSRPKKQMGLHKFKFFRSKMVQISWATCLFKQPTKFFN